MEMSDEQLAEAPQEVEETGRLRGEQLQHRKDGTPLHVDSLTIAMRDEGARLPATWPSTATSPSASGQRRRSETGEYHRLFLRPDVSGTSPSVASLLHLTICSWLRPIRGRNSRKCGGSTSHTSQNFKQPAKTLL